MNAVYFWLVLAGITLVLELTSPAFLFICFTGGSLIAALSAVWVDSVAVQAVVFAVASVILIPLTRPAARRMSRSETAKTNVDALIGETAYVLEEINGAANTGRVRIGGEEWRAAAETVIPVQTEVTVTAVKGTTVTVVSKN